MKECKEEMSVEERDREIKKGRRRGEVRGEGEVKEEGKGCKNGEEDWRRIKS